ncbi:MAG TPA: BamA/TamA family outer membrane protein, partial [Candidatus Udaeobacter sp.]|nr:BamA/TamA family outer membrane protein [Candidatus Udaeobacter sp.]
MIALAPEPAAAGRKLIAISPLPAPDSAVVAAEGKIVRTLSITGNKVTKEYIIIREVEHEVGKPFSLQTMAADRTRLDNLGIFSFVAITPDSSGADSVDVEVMVREMPWLIPYPALKVSDQTGFTIGPAVSSMNLLGRDITLSGRVMFGGATTYQVNLDWPWITGNHVSMTMFAAHILRDDDVRNFDETSDEFSPWVGTYVGRSGRLRAGYSYFHMRSDEAGITLTEDNSDSFHRLGAAAGYDTRDSWVNAHRGWDNEVQTFRSFGAGDFWTTDLDVTRYQPLGKNTFVINGLASLQSGDIGVDVPIYMDYVMGGANSIRGYQVDELGKELSGKNQLITTLEYQYLLWDVREIALYGFPITMGVELAAFIDTGLAWNTSNQFN